MIFHDPLVFILLPFVAGIIFYAQRKSASSGFRFSSGELLGGLTVTFKVFLSRNLFVLRIFAVSFVIFALARPQAPLEDSKIETQGIDIVLALDCSTSMLAEDFKVAGKRESRIDIVKTVVKDFVKMRKNDRISVVVFAAQAYPLCPLTLDHSWLLSNLERVKAGMIEDGTAIGLGIATSLNRLKNSKAKTRIVVLLTDGRNNTGKISPQTAAEAALALKVKIYCIGAGAKGLVPYPVQDMFGNRFYQQVELDLDEDILKKIATETTAKYFRATDTESLKKTYEEIDRLEKTPFEEKGYHEYRELFPIFLVPGLCLLFFEVILAHTILRKIP